MNLGADGSTTKCIIVGLIVEADEELEIESLSKYKTQDKEESCFSQRQMMFLKAEQTMTSF